MMPAAWAAESARQIWVAIATVAAAFIPWHGHGRAAVTIALSIAAAKSLLILLYFMHVKFSPKMVYAFAGAGFLWLGIMFTLILSDYLTRNWPPHSNPKGEPRYLDASLAHSEATR